MTLSNTLKLQLDDTSVAVERFREIVGRLYATGVIFRDDNAFEEKLYDDARRLGDLLHDYFSLAGFRLLHDTDSCFMRLYPPGAWVPGLGEADGEGEKLLKTRLSADFVALTLVLRFLYQQGLAEGRVEVNDEVHVRMEDIALAMSAHLARTLPEGKTDRQNLFREMKRQRVVRFNEETDFNNGDGFIAIRRPILSLVGEETLQAAMDLVESRKPAVIEEEKPAGAEALGPVAAAGVAFTPAADNVVTLPNAVVESHMNRLGSTGDAAGLGARLIADAEQPEQVAITAVNADDHGDA